MVIYNFIGANETTNGSLTKNPLQETFRYLVARALLDDQSDGSSHILVQLESEMDVLLIREEVHMIVLRQSAQ